MNIPGFRPRPVHELFPARPPACLLLIAASLVWCWPQRGHALDALGNKQTSIATRTKSGKIVLSGDPDGVEEFQLHVQFDPAKAMVLKQTLRTPFVDLSVVPLGNNAFQISGRITDLTMLHPGDVDIFAIEFDDPTVPGFAGGPDPKFSLFATGNDFLVSNVGGVRTRFSAAEIGSSTRTSTAAVSPMVWDPNGIFNDGIMGGAGTWNTSSARFDPLPISVLGEAAADIAWNNTTNVHDVAVFSGNVTAPVAVTLATPIAAGGLQFEISGYTLQGSTLTLSQSPGSVPTIDTGVSNATINTVLAGTMGFEKRGKGTLTLGGANSYTGTTTIKAGTVKLDRTVGGTLNSTTPLTIAGNATFAYLTSSGGPSQTLGTLTFAAGDGTVDILNPVASANYLTFASLAARAPGATANFAFSGGGTIDNAYLFTTPPVASGFINQGVFFSGNGYATYFTPGGVQFINYGGTANSAPTNSIVADNHISLTATQPAQNTISLRTLRFVGAVDFSLNAGQTLTLSNGGLLKTFFGQSTISGGTGITAGAAEFVIRPVDSPDTINIATPILASSTGGLTKSGAGTLILSANNAYTGTTTVNQGQLLVTGMNGASPILLREEATLAGTGKVAAVGGGGTVSPGVGNVAPARAAVLSVSVGAQPVGQATQRGGAFQIDLPTLAAQSQPRGDIKFQLAGAPGGGVQPEPIVFIAGGEEMVDAHRDGRRSGGHSGMAGEMRRRS